MTVHHYNALSASVIKDQLDAFESYYHETNPKVRGSRQAKLPANYNKVRSEIENLISEDEGISGLSDLDRNKLIQNLNSILGQINLHVTSKVYGQIAGYNKQLRSNLWLTAEARRLITSKSRILGEVGREWTNVHELADLNKEDLQDLHTNRGWSVPWETRSSGSELAYQTVMQAVPVYRSITNIIDKLNNIRPPGQTHPSEWIELQSLVAKSESLAP